MTLREARRFIDGVERRLAPLDRAILLAEWRLASGRSRTGARLWQERRHRLLSAPDVLESTRRFRSSGVSGLLDRRLGLLERATLESRIEQDPEIVVRRSRLQARVSGFRPRWHGRRVDRIVVRTALRTHPDRAERRRAWYAEDPLYRSIEDDLRAVVALRNEKARELGFRSYPEFRLSFDGISVAGLQRLLGEWLRLVPAEMRRRREEFEDRTGGRGWYPWDAVYASHLSRGLPEAAFPSNGMLPSVLRGVRAWGFPPSALRFRVDRHDIPSGGLCIAPDPPRDVRIVVHPGRGWGEYMVLFHEVGHGVHSASVRAPTHLLRWSEGLPGFGGFHEGIGQFFELIAESEPWLLARGNLSAREVGSFVAETRRTPLASMASLVGWIREELDLYLRPTADPAERSRRFGRTVCGFDAYEPRSFADSFFVEAPIYATSYLVAALLRPQLLAAALEEVGGPTWPNRKMGPWLVRHWFREGSAFDWQPRVRELSGRTFGARAFNESMR